MATSVQDYITAAYLRSTTNDPGKLAQNTELIGHLNRAYQRTWMLIARARPDQYSAETTLTLAGVPPTVALPANLIDLLDVTDSDGATVTIIPATQRTRTWNLAPCVYRVGMTLKTRGDADDPIAADALTVLYLDAPTTLTLLADEVDDRWPARHDQLLVDYLASYLSVKDAGRDQNDRQALLTEQRANVAAFAAEYTLAPAQVGWLHADAERSTA